LPDKDGENPVNVQPEDTFNMDESGCTTGSSFQSYAGARADCRK
jgi:hypothetical protein